MKIKGIRTKVFIVGAALAVTSVVLVAQQDRFTLKSPNGIAFSEIRGYEAWQVVAPSQTDAGIKAILGNPTLINAYREGVPRNGKAFPDGSIFAKIEWVKKKDVESPYAVDVPDTLKSISVMEKDSRRFPDTDGWGYAQFNYDPVAKTFKPYGTDSSFGKKVCHECHTSVQTKDFVFTGYAAR